MTRCVFCHMPRDLDSKGRCPSCADAGDATAYGLHYGEYMYRKEHGLLPGESARRIPLNAPQRQLPRCKVCGNTVMPPFRTYCSDRCAHEGKRQIAHLAHMAGKPVKTCPVCGKEVPNDSRRTYCSFECYEANQREYLAKRHKAKRKEGKK